MNRAKCATHASTHASAAQGPGATACAVTDTRRTYAPNAANYEHLKNSSAQVRPEKPTAWMKAQSDFNRIIKGIIRPAKPRAVERD